MSNLPNEFYTKLAENKEIQNFLTNFNLEHLIPIETYNNYPFISSENTFLMLALGIPMGLLISVDLNTGKEIPNICDSWDDNFYRKYPEVSEEMTEYIYNLPNEQVIYKYIPINNSQDMKKYVENYSLILYANDKFLPFDKLKNIEFCLQFIADNNIFDKDTQLKIQKEIIDNCPLKYNITMSIYNKYFTTDIQDKIIQFYNVDPNIFYNLSGLKRNTKCVEENPTLNITI